MNIHAMSNLVAFSPQPPPAMYSPYLFCNDYEDQFMVFGLSNPAFKEELEKALDLFQSYGDVMQVNCCLHEEHIDLYYLLSSHVRYSKSKSKCNIEDVCRSHEEFFTMQLIPFYAQMKTFFGCNTQCETSLAKKVESPSSLYVLYNIPLKLSIVLDESKVPASTWSRHPDTFAVCKGSYMELYSPTFQEKPFESMSALKCLVQKLDEAMTVAMSANVVLSKEITTASDKQVTTNDVKQTPVSEKNKVVSYIQTNYVILDNVEPEYRMRAQDIAEELEKSLHIENDQSFRIRLAGYLVEAGLKKKRFSNGFYYYGIKNKFNPPSKDDITKMDLDALLKARETEAETSLKNTKPYWTPIGSLLQVPSLDHLQPFNEKIYEGTGFTAPDGFTMVTSDPQPYSDVGDGAMHQWCSNGV
jgi:hypothetical protein